MKIFIAGSRRLSKLNADLRQRLDNIVEKGMAVIVGDANGADKAIQQYLAERRYSNVTVFCMRGHCRNNMGSWPTRAVVAANPSRHDFAYFSTKDRAMALEATHGLMLWDGESRGTFTNIRDLVQQGKPVVVYFSPTKTFQTVRERDDLTRLLRHSDPVIARRLEEQASENQQVADLLRRIGDEPSRNASVVLQSTVSASAPNAGTACDVIREHSRQARLAVHSGTASLVADGDVVTGPAEFILPAGGAPIVAFRASQPITNNFGEDLRIVGSHDGRSFTLASPVCYMRKPASEGWSLISPINEPVRIEYSEAKPVKIARVLLNNFDYECGDASVSASGFTRMGTPMVVQLTDRKATFSRRADYDSVYPLLHAGLLRSASLTECSFEVLAESDEDLLLLANDVASLLTIAHGGSVGVAMMELLDADGRPARRIVTQPIRSSYRDDAIVTDFELPRLFQESFEAHVEMRRSNLPWHKLPSYCGSLDDMPYIEQKFAALMMALEFFMRVSVVEHGAVEAEVAKFDWNQLVGATKKQLRWNIPKHYSSRDTLRLLRNAVMHGGNPPVKDSTEFRLLFNKWRLFLFRRILIRLGYKGPVISPWKGVAESSAVDDFSEEHNSFDQTETDTHPFVQFVKYLKEHNEGKSLKVRPKAEA